MVSKVIFSRKADDWRTPRHLFNCLQKIFGKFDLDPCASEDNHLGVPNYFTVRDDGLNRKWFGNVYVNPPYSQTKKWIRKAVKEVSIGNAKQVVMLLASRTDTEWFHDLVIPNASIILFIRGRIRFEGAKYSAPFPSMIVCFRSDKNLMWGTLDYKKCKISLLRCRNTSA